MVKKIVKKQKPKPEDINEIAYRVAQESTSDKTIKQKR
jgi:hypothetical protein